MRILRLACVWCDRDDYDGIVPDQLATCGFTGVTDVATYKADPLPSPPANDVPEWCSHIGWCPSCSALFNSYLRPKS